MSNNTLTVIYKDKSQRFSNPPFNFDDMIREINDAFQINPISFIYRDEDGDVISVANQFDYNLALSYISSKEDITLEVDKFEYLNVLDWNIINREGSDIIIEDAQSVIYTENRNEITDLVRNKIMLYSNDIKLRTLNAITNIQKVPLKEEVKHVGDNIKEVINNMIFNIKQANIPSKCVNVYEDVEKKIGDVLENIKKKVVFERKKPEKIDMLKREKLRAKKRIRKELKKEIKAIYRSILDKAVKKSDAFIEKKYEDQININKPNIEGLKFQCFDCQKENLEVIYQCSKCEDLNLCSACEATIEHPHNFYKIKKSQILKQNPNIGLSEESIELRDIIAMSEDVIHI